MTIGQKDDQRANASGSACHGCPYGHRRPLANMIPESIGAEPFLDLVESGAAPEPLRLQKARTGIDLVDGPHQAVDPGWADFAQIEDLAERAFALIMNDVSPVCQCARRLLESVSHETTPYSLAVKMRLLETSRSSWDGVRDHRPPQPVRRGVKKPKPPRGQQDVWSAFGVDV